MLFEQNTLKTKQLKFVFDISLPVFIIVCRTTGMTQLKVHAVVPAICPAYHGRMWIQCECRNRLWKKNDSELEMYSIRLITGIHRIPSKAVAKSARFSKRWKF